MAVLAHAKWLRSIASSPEVHIRVGLSMGRAFNFAIFGDSKSARGSLQEAEDHATRAGHQIPKSEIRRVIVLAEIFMTEAIDARNAGDRTLETDKVNAINDLMRRYDIGQPSRLAQFLQS